VAVICGLLGVSAEPIPKIRTALEDQLEEGLHLIAQRLEHPRIAGNIAWRPFLGAWGFRTLPISFEYHAS